MKQMQKSTFSLLFIKKLKLRNNGVVSICLRIATLNGRIEKVMVKRTANKWKRDIKHNHPLAIVTIDWNILSANRNPIRTFK